MGRQGVYVAEAASSNGTGTLLKLDVSNTAVGSAPVMCFWVSFDPSVPVSDWVVRVVNNGSDVPEWRLTFPGGVTYYYLDSAATAALNVHVPSGFSPLPTPFCPFCIEWFQFDFGPSLASKGIAVGLPPFLGLSAPYPRVGDVVRVHVDESLTWSSADAELAFLDCPNCPVKLVAAESSPVSVSSAGKNEWTFSLSALGRTSLDVFVGEFQVGVVDVGLPSVLEDVVPTAFGDQRVRVVDPFNVLPIGTQLLVDAVPTHEGIDDTHTIEHVLSYSISLVDENGDALPMPLERPVELYFEVLDGLDEDELEGILIRSGIDGEFDERLVQMDGSRWVKVTTDHFSPYALIDTLSAEEKAVLNAQPENDLPASGVPTGDVAAQTVVAGLGIVLVLALGIMLRLITNKKKFEE